jgi:guanosine-3',5'-bis(diphosphate) 3'-pyrophosphohydrolase
MSVQSHYQQAIKFSTARHAAKQQKVPGTNLPYVVHLSNVAMEVIIAGSQTPGFDLDFAVQVALLHDTIEDTETIYQELSDTFGRTIADGVLALTKDATLPKEQRTMDSLTRIRKMPKEVWAVKLADRINNLQPPPGHWSKDKRLEYQNEARLILEILGEGNTYLAQRLRTLIIEYGEYL